MDLSLWWKAALLGIVEGVTEFLPISSTGHLIIAGTVIQYHDPNFEIVIQLGAILAVVVCYRHDLWKKLTSIGRSCNDRKVTVNVLVAFLPAAVLGALLHKAIKLYLFTPLTVALAFSIGGVAIMLVERYIGKSRTNALEQITLRQGLAIGMAQILAMWPGFSRAAASIMGGMAVGLDRRTATLFSFYLAIPTMFGAAIVDLVGARHELHRHDIAPYAIGFLVSFGVAWGAVKGLLRYIAHHNFNPFGIYRILLGGLILCLLFSHRL